MKWLNNKVSFCKGHDFNWALDLPGVKMEPSDIFSGLWFKVTFSQENVILPLGCSKFLYFFQAKN